MGKLLVVRMRGEIGTRRGTIDTFKMLGMKKLYSFAIVEDTPSNKGMIQKIENFAAWGEATAEIEKSLHGKDGLKSPKGGFKSKKLRYPRGNLGYCGDKINDMVKKMI
jgi:ribosomal protein L30/L7E